ncbi:hypothetical protein L209DRAFT_764653 [Thermothelomyces heterothallicus CBS 203.75]
MSFNRILSRKTLGSVLTPSSRLVNISVATQTEAFTRPEFIADKMKDALEAAVIANENILPPNTAEVCSREGDHTSESDSRSHITAVCFDAKGEHIKTVHLVTQKK